MKNLNWRIIIGVFLVALSAFVYPFIISILFPFFYSLRNLRNLRINRCENPFPLYIMEPEREAIPWVC